MESIKYLFSEYYKINQKIYNFQKKLETTDISEEQRPEFHIELETIHQELETLQNVAVKVNHAILRQLLAINEQIIGLFGQIEERFETYEVTLIARQALVLGNLVTNGRMMHTAALANQLKDHIQFFFEQRLPSLHNRTIIQIAQKLAEEAGSIQEDKTKMRSLHFIGLLRMLIQEAIERTERFLYPDEAELAIELYEIMELYSHHYTSEARHRLKGLLYRLPSRASKCLDETLSDEQCAHLLTALIQEVTQGSLESLCHTLFT